MRVTLSTFFRIACSLGLFVALGVARAPARAITHDAVVGNGTPASCTGAALTSAFAAITSGGVADGRITFNCGPSEVIISLSTGYAIDGRVELDGGGLVNLSGGGVLRHFSVNLDSVLTLRNITLSGGRAQGDYGGAVAVQQDGTLYADNVLIASNVATLSGGAIAAFERASVTIVNSQINYNRADGNGGGISANGATVTISNTLMRNNQGNAGGALESWFGAVTVANSELHTNNAVGSTVDANGGGGAITVRAGSLLITGTRILSNTAAGGGGVLAWESGNQVTLVNSQVRANRATQRGGGLLVMSREATVSGTTASYNSADLGGGIGVQDGALQVTSSVVEWNSAGNVVAGTGAGGGGIWAAQSTLYVFNSRVSSNEARDSGGGIMFDGLASSVLQVLSSTVRNNYTSVYGGGVFVYSGQVMLNGAHVLQNTGRLDGGGVYALSRMQVLGSVIAENRSDTGEGGGIYNRKSSTAADPEYLLLGYSAVVSNVAVAGGGIANYGALTLTQVTLSANSAADRGGAVLNANTAPSVFLPQTALLSATSLVSNSAPLGGAIYNDTGSVLAVQGVVFANSRDGGAPVLNCELLQGLSTVTNTVSSDNSCQSPSVAIALAPLAALPTLATPFVIQPAVTFGHVPERGSALLDAFACADAEDQRGAARPAGAACDIGAIERQPTDGVRRVLLPLIVR